MLKKSLIILLSFSAIPFAFGQSTDDTEAWVSAAASIDLVKKVDLEAGFAARFNTNISHLNSYNFDLGIVYKLSKKWKSAVRYRYTNKIETYANRISLEARWNDEIVKRTFLSIRPRLQRDYNLYNATQENTFRTKLEISYKIKKTKLFPSLYTEFFYNLHSVNNEFNRLRVGSSIDIKTIDNHTFSLGFFKSIGLGTEISKNRNIFTLDYSLKL